MNPTGEHTTIFFYLDVDSQKATELVHAERDRGRHAMSRDATTQYVEREPCDAVVIMPEVPAHHVERIRKVYADVPVTELKPHEEPDIQVVPISSASIDLSAMTNKELRSLAVTRGVDVRQYKTRDEMIAAMQ